MGLTDIEILGLTMMIVGTVGLDYLIMLYRAEKRGLAGKAPQRRLTPISDLQKDEREWRSEHDMFPVGSPGPSGGIVTAPGIETLDNGDIMPV